MTTQNSTTEKKEISLFRPRPKTLTSLRFKYHKNILEKETYKQEQFDISEYIPKEKNICNGYLAYNILDYDTISHFYDCSLTGTYILNNKMIPVLYADIYLSRKIMQQPMFRMYLNFEFDQETLEKVKTPQACFNSDLYGKMTISLDIIEKYKKFVMEKNTEYQKIFNIIPCDKKFPNKKFFVNHVVKLLQTELFKNIVSDIIDNIESEVNDALEYTISKPKRILNLKELKENPSKIDEMLCDNDTEESEFE